MFTRHGNQHKAIYQAMSMDKTLPGSTSFKESPEILFRRYYSRFCHFAFLFLKEEKAAEDVVQDAFVSFWKNREQVSDHPAAIKNYFYTSIRNACYNIHKRARVEARFQKLYQPEESEEPVFLEAMIRAEVMQRIYEVVSDLPQGCAQVFRMGYLEGLSNPEIAEQLGVSVNTVKTQKRRALLALRTRLKPEALSIIVLLEGWI